MALTRDESYILMKNEFRAMRNVRTVDLTDSAEEKDTKCVVFREGAVRFRKKTAHCELPVGKHKKYQRTDSNCRPHGLCRRKGH